MLYSCQGWKGSATLYLPRVGVLPTCCRRYVSTPSYTYHVQEGVLPYLPHVWEYSFLHVPRARGSATLRATFGSATYLLYEISTTSLPATRGSTTYLLLKGSTSSYTYPVQEGVLSYLSRVGVLPTCSRRKASNPTPTYLAQEGVLAYLGHVWECYLPCLSVFYL